MNFNRSRRDVLIGGGAVAITAAAGVSSWVVLADEHKALLDYFKKLLPGVRIDEESAAACIDEFLARWSWKERRAVSVAWRTFGVETMGNMSDKFEIAARKALTMYLTNSNFFDVSDPRATTIVYVGGPTGAACTNSFANLDPPAPDA
ncbi:hypothetical protein [Sinorhizobium sp. BJ1]|jgi:hypothetical protein|uniref:hypothetical protein n=1 Tax=Sinorhizobium sp. BJ1 TaxID=2035455 RepID=UPI000BEA1BC2|nr:hypothetical protein [Sinorhizobium sp. BJ1]PDT81473.1 hypothetical protein CO676_22225 [Sinorhizobium sp. BJ1]